MQVAAASDRDEEEDASISPTGGPRSNGARWTVNYHIHIPPTKHQNRTAPTLQPNIRWNHSIPKLGMDPFHSICSPTKRYLRSCSCFGEFLVSVWPKKRQYTKDGKNTVLLGTSHRVHRCLFQKFHSSDVPLLLQGAAYPI